MIMKWEEKWKILANTTRTLRRRRCFTHSTKLNKHEEDIKRYSCRLEVDHVSGSEYEDEDFEDADEVRRGPKCHNRGMR